MSSTFRTFPSVPPLGRAEVRPWFGAAVPRPRTTVPGTTWNAPSVLVLLLTAVLPVLPAFDMEVGGVRIDSVTFFLVPAILLTGWAALLGALRAAPAFRELPHWPWWGAYAALVAVAYASGASALGYLTDPIRAAYQVYNYSLKELLLYPLVFVLFFRPRMMKVLVIAIIAASLLNAIAAVPQGRAGQLPGGFLGLYTKNYLAGSFLIPAFLSLGCASYARGWRARAVYAAAFGVFLLGLWYAGSRGGMLAFGFGLILFLTITDRRFQLAGVGVLVIVGLLFLKPDFGVRSGIREHFTAVSEGADESNLKWRTTERWPHFLNKVREHPWVGIGTDWDPMLADSMNVPHNGYLSLAIKSGVPALAILLGLVASVLCRSFTIARRSADPWARGIGLAVFAGVAAVCVHNVVDAVLDRGVVLYTFWTLLAVVSAIRHSERTASA